MRRTPKNPSWPGFADDYRRIRHFPEMPRPDIWLAQHNESCDVDGKRQP